MKNMNAKQRRLKRRKDLRPKRRLSTNKPEQKPAEPASPSAHSESWLSVFNALAGIAVPFEVKKLKEDEEHV